MVRDVVAIASNALERRVILMWLDAGYRPTTIYRRISDKRRIYRRLRRTEKGSGIARRLSCAKVTRTAQRETRSRPGDAKLNARVMKASLQAWADALRALGKQVPAWIPESQRTSPSGLISEYWSYTQRVRNLSQASFKDHRLYISWFLKHLKRQKTKLMAITLTDVDQFVSTLTSHRKLAVTTTGNACICLRHFLRFLFRTGRIATDLSPGVIGPSTRQMLKRPPPRIAWTELNKVLQAIDRTLPLGKRDFAIFITAASYGWGAAEVLSLRLDDIDWHRNRLSVVRPKTGVRTQVPLRPEVALALASYIQTARPRNTGMREVFLRHYAPWAKVPTATTIAGNLGRYARAAGVSLPICGTKLFRCAHIAEQLNRGVPPKIIADVVGHSDTRSISRYAGVNIEQLRSCALPVPT